MQKPSARAELTVPQEPEDFTFEASAVNEVARAAMDIAGFDHLPDLSGLCGIPCFSKRCFPDISKRRHFITRVDEPVAGDAQVGDADHASVAHQKVGPLEVLFHSFDLLGRIQNLRSTLF